MLGVVRGFHRLDDGQPEGRLGRPQVRLHVNLRQRTYARVAEEQDSILHAGVEEHVCGEEGEKRREQPQNMVYAS